MSEKLGLGHSPEKVDVLFVGEAEDATGSTPWYLWDHDSGKAIPVHEDALTGHVTNVTVTNKPFRDKPNYKLNIHVQADRKYIIRAGVATTFSRGFVLGFSELIDKQPVEHVNPITISVKKSDEGNAMFCGVWSRGHKFVPQWDSESLSDRIANLQRRLGQVVQTKEMMDNPELYRQAVQEERDRKERIQKTAVEVEEKPKRKIRKKEE